MLYYQKSYIYFNVSFYNIEYMFKQLSLLSLLTAPVSISYIRAPKLHQSTALPWPLRVRISGALEHITIYLLASDYQTFLINIHTCVLVLLRFIFIWISAHCLTLYPKRDVGINLWKYGMCEKNLTVLSGKGNLFIKEF